MGESSRFWRVYKSEWCVMHVADSDGEEGRLECLQALEQRYAGRIMKPDARLVPWSEADPGQWPWMLELHLPVMKGEHVTRPPALEQARKIDGVAVLEGSRADLKILGYGKKMLREGSLDGQGVDAASLACGAAGEASGAGA